MSTDQPTAAVSNPETERVVCLVYYSHKHEFKGKDVYVTQYDPTGDRPFSTTLTKAEAHKFTPEEAAAFVDLYTTLDLMHQSAKVKRVLVAPTVTTKYVPPANTKRPRSHGQGKKLVPLPTFVQAMTEYELTMQAIAQKREEARLAYERTVGLLDLSAAQAHTVVAEALHADTKEFNTLDSCYLVNIDTARKWVTQLKELEIFQ